MEKDAKLHAIGGKDDEKMIKYLRDRHPDIHDRLVRALGAERNYYGLMHSVGLSGVFLENACKDDGALDLLMHPVAGSKDITDAFLRKDISSDFDVFEKELKKLRKSARNKKINEYLASFKKGEIKRANLKGMEAKRNKKKGTFAVTITLSRSTKGQNEKQYSVEMSCQDLNYKLTNVLDSFVVWFRNRGKDGLWMHKVVAFCPLTFFVKNFSDFKQYDTKKGDKKQKQYKYENHTKFTRLTINPGASYQFNCVCSDLESFIKESSAEVLYDSWENKCI